MTEPTGYTAVGMVGFTDKGTYSASVSYVKNDLVHYGGSIWCCLIDDTTGITPTEGVNWRFWVENSQNGISDIVNVLGAKNLLKISMQTTSSRGITVNDNGDGSITVDGTATETAYFNIMHYDFGDIRFSTEGTSDNSNYILSGLPSNSNFYIAYNPSTKFITVAVKPAYGAVDNVTIYPMIRPKGIEDDTWVPYTKTNKELTEEVTQNSSDIQTLANKINEIESNTKTEILLFGDSWADYTHDADNVRIPSVLSNHFGVTVHNYAYGGTGFDVTNGYDEQITRMIADNIDYSKVKCAILVCGLNDYQRTTTKEQFTAMLADWYDKLTTAIGYNIPIYWFNNYSIANDLTLTNPTTFYQQFSHYNHVRANVNKPIIMPLTFGWVSLWHNDTHPNATGSTDYALNMCRAIEGIVPILFKYQSIAIPFGTNGATIDYYYNGKELLECYWNADLADMLTITATRALAYSHTPPCRLVDGCYLNEGHSIAANDYVNITMAVNNPSMLTDITYTAHGKLFVPIKMA